MKMITRIWVTKMGRKSMMRNKLKKRMKSKKRSMMKKKRKKETASMEGGMIQMV